MLKCVKDTVEKIQLLEKEVSCFLCKKCDEQGDLPVEKIVEILGDISSCLVNIEKDYNWGLKKLQPTAKSWDY